MRGQTVYQVAASETASYAVVKRRGVMAVLLKAGMELPPPPMTKSSDRSADQDVTPATKSALGGGNRRRNFGKASRRGVSFGDTTVYNVDEEEDSAAAAAAASARNAAKTLSQYRGNSLVVWGTGTYGQLGLGPAVTEARTPTMVPAFEEEQVSVRYVACSSTHAACIAGRNSNLYVWGHNRFHSLGLGRDMEAVAVVYAPAKVLQFNTIVDGIGRGKPRSVACGRYFTVVATHAYTGIDVAEAMLAAAGAKKALVEDDKARATELEMRRKMALEKAAEEDRLRKQAAINELSFAAPPPCTLCTACTGFQPDPFAPALCRFCTHLRSRHNTASDLRKHALLGGSGPKKPSTQDDDDDDEDSDEGGGGSGKPEVEEKRKGLFYY
jgi:Regulator of chromosome condensation (RCC1) repeat